jgi:hypothetical protein
MIKLQHKILVFALAMLVSAAGYSQAFKNAAKIDSVGTTGFYQINITPELSAYLKTDFSDLRIMDDKNRQVPYIVRSLLPGINQNVFNEFPVISNIKTDSGSTVLILENKGFPLKAGNVTQRSINELLLFIKNTSSKRYASLSGSNNNKDWFTISENFFLPRSYQADAASFISEIRFSTVDYKYLKLVINNDGADGLNIIKTGSYAELTFQSLKPLVTENPAAIIAQTDSNNQRSYITVTQTLPFQTDNITITVTGAKFYERRVWLYLPENDSSNKPRATAEASFIIASNLQNQFAVKKFKASKFYLVVENKDNPPLQITAVATSQEPVCIVANFEKNISYTLQLNNEQATAPDYDIKLFKDSIAAVLPIVKCGPVFKNQQAENISVAKNNSNWWVWPVIIAAIIILGLLAFKLLADMKKKDL